MPFDQYPSLTPTFPDLIRPPRNGDGDDATQINVDDLQPLQNGVEAARLLTYGMAQNGRRIVAPTGGVLLTVKALGFIVVRQSAGNPFICLPHAADTVGLDVTTIGCSGVINTKWFLYAKNTPVAGVPTIAFACNTTAPDAGSHYAGGDETLFYLGSFYLNPNGNIIAYVQNDRDVRFTDRSAQGVGAFGNLVLDAGAALAQTGVSDVKGILPPNVLGLTISTKFVGKGGADTQTQIYTSGGTIPIGWIENNFLGTDTREYSLGWSSGPLFDYRVSDASSSLTVWLAGYSF